jgi:hypothetical protein
VLVDILCGFQSLPLQDMNFDLNLISKFEFILSDNQTKTMSTTNVITNSTAARDNNSQDQDIPDIGFLDIKDLLPGEQPEMTDFRRLEKTGTLLPEPLLMAEKSRFVLFPIKHNDVSFFDLLLSLNFSYSYFE